jgi:hypothetical protein
MKTYRFSTLIMGFSIIEIESRTGVSVNVNGELVVHTQ